MFSPSFWVDDRDAQLLFILLCEITTTTIEYKSPWHNSSVATSKLPYSNAKYILV